MQGSVGRETRWTRWAVPTAAVLLCACGIVSDNDCTLAPSPGIVVQVVDDLTLAPVTDQVQGFITQSNYFEEMFLDGNELRGAPDREGVYTVLVLAEGFRVWTKTGVSVEGNGCHVTTEHRSARLVAEDSI